MTNTLLIDVGQQESYFTTVYMQKDKETVKYINTKQATSKTYREMFEEVIEILIDKEIEILRVDPNGYGKGLLEILVEKFDEMKLNYNPVSGRVYSQIK